MKYPVLLALGVLLLIVSCAKQPSVSMEKVIDLGTFVQGDIMEYTYRYTNAGSNDISIDQIVAGCGCTKAVPVGDRNVKPGQEGQVSISIDTSEKDADFSVSLTLFTKEPQRKVMRLNLNGHLAKKEV